MIKIISTYQKKIGLPSFSSHCYELSVSTEVKDLSEIERESERLYATLQDCVDRELSCQGVVPGLGGNDLSPQRQAPRKNNQPQTQAQNEPDHEGWSCSEKQEQFIRRIMQENNLTSTVIDDLAHQRFGRPAPRLNRMQASGMIDALLDQYGTKGKGNQR